MDAKKVPHLKVDRGRYYYRRRVPLKLQKALGFKLWNIPCGEVSYARAVTIVTNLTDAHDQFMDQLRTNPALAEERRRKVEEEQMWAYADTLVEAVHTSQTNPTKMKEVYIQEDNPLIGQSVSFEPLRIAADGLNAIEENDALDHQDRLIRYKSILDAAFGNHVTPPNDPDERDEYDLIKRKLERRIAAIAGNPNTISAVAERSYDFAGITAEVRNKYRRSVRTLTNQVGDIPLNHLTAQKLREFRDAQAANMTPTSLRALFTPIRGLFRFAIENEIVDLNPMPSVPMPKEKRSVQMRKWQPFSPEEVQRIFKAMDYHWGPKSRGLSVERRRAIHMVVRVMAFSCLRPKEVLTLKPENVTDKWIKVIGSKTEGSDRTVPLHPEIADFPAFFHAGGFDTFKSQKKDPVQSVRHNFGTLIRKKMDPPIQHQKKVLYSWRSTFSNAMRRAGADGEMRRAILGHTEAGALKHYDDGPEFAKKRKWVRASDPRRVYLDPGEDDDLE